MLPFRRRMLLMGACCLLAACGSEAATSPAGSGPRPVTVRPDGGASAAPGSPAAGASAASGKVKLAVGYVANNPAHFPAWVAKERGFFDQNGLDVTLTPLPGGSDPTKALIAGQVQALEISVEAIEADEEGADLVYVAGPFNSLLFSLYGNAGITSPDALKGKRVGFTRAGSASSAALKAAVASLKLDVTKDVTPVPLEREPAVLAALQNGTVDAAVLNQTAVAQARAAGLRQLVDVAKTDAAWPLAWDAVSKKYRDQQPAVVGAIVKSLVQAIAFATQQPTPVLLIMAKYSAGAGAASGQPAAGPGSGIGPGTGQGDSRGGPGSGAGPGTGQGPGSGTGRGAGAGTGAAGKAVLDALLPYLQRQPAPVTRAVDAALREMAAENPKASQLKSAGLVDPSFVNNLQASGFIAGLYK
jgi:NitT/TauT family transport system substrate-binding protein